MSSNKRPLCPSALLAFGLAAVVHGAAWAAEPAPAAAEESDQAYCDRQEPRVREICYRQYKLGTPAALPARAAAPAPAPSAAPGAAKPAVAAPPPAPKPAPTAATPAPAPAAPAKPAAGGLYTVSNGTVVDANTFKGFQTWRQAACDRCHGAQQEGAVGPSLVNSLKVLSKAEFLKVVTEGRNEKGMPAFSGNAALMENINNLYAYLKGRSDGAITNARVSKAE